MKVISKFLTAEVRITSATWADGRVVVEGLVKEFMPMTVEVTPDDVRSIVGLLAEPVRARIAHQLPPWVVARLAFLAPPEPPPENPYAQE